MVKTTRPQRETLLKIFKQHKQKGTYREFRRNLLPEICGDAVMIKLDFGLWIGIEPDGHPHT